MQGHSQTFTGFCWCHRFDWTVARAVFAKTLRIRDTSAQTKYFIRLAAQKL